MDGWNTSFLLAWPIFRGEPSVLGSVPYKSCLQNVTALLRLIMSHCIMNLKLALTKFPDLQWVLPFGYSYLAPILVVPKWIFAFLRLIFWILHMNRCEPLQMSYGQLASGKCWSFLAPLTQRWFLSIWFLAWQMFFFSRDPGREATKTWWKGWKTIWGGKGWKQNSWISWGWKVAPSNSYTIDTFQHLERGAKWFRYGVSIHHPFGFNWHPFEGAGWGIYITLFWVGVMRETCR